jgi:hypothetical protein
MAIKDGSFPGFSLASLGALAKVGQLLSGDFSGKGSSKGTTFSILSADLNIAGGRVASNRAHMESNLGTMDLKGSFGFDETLAYDGQATLSSAASGGGSGSPQSVLTGILGQVTKQNIGSLSIPFAVTGTFAKPKVVPGKGLPGLKTAPPAGTQQQQPQEPAKKKSILDIFKKPGQ